MSKISKFALQLKVIAKQTAEEIKENRQLGDTVFDANRVLQSISSDLTHI